MYKTHFNGLQFQTNTCGTTSYYKTNEEHKRGCRGAGAQACDFKYGSCEQKKKQRTECLL